VFCGIGIRSISSCCVQNSPACMSSAACLVIACDSSSNSRSNVIYLHRWQTSHDAVICNHFVFFVIPEVFGRFAVFGAGDFLSTLNTGFLHLCRPDCIFDNGMHNQHCRAQSGRQIQGDWATAANGERKDTKRSQTASSR